jgi:hypothetical protein
MENGVIRNTRPFKWWDVGVFTLVIVVFTLAVWRAEKSGGACYDQNCSHNFVDPATQGAVIGDTTNPESYLCRLIAPANLPTIYLVFIGIGGILAAFRTLGTIQQQTAHISRQALSMRRQTTILRNSVRAARKGAKAALLNAQAVIDSERAWMVGMAAGHRLNEPPNGNNNLRYNCKITNIGRTPSKILEVGLAFRKVDSLKNIPPNPTYSPGDITPFNKITVVPSDFIPVSTTLVPHLSLEEFAAFRGKNLHLYGYGYVKYLDVFSGNKEEVRESRFCHHYYIPFAKERTEEGFRPCIEAPPEYHEAT